MITTNPALGIKPPYSRRDPAEAITFLVQDLLGHADPRTTSIYVYVGDLWDNNPALFWLD